MPVIFKELLMLCQTDSGKMVRRYYLAMVDALEIYMAYQSMIVVKQKTDKIDKLMTQMAINEAKADEERKKADERYKTLLGIARKNNWPL